MIDRYRDDTKLMLILCGSSMSFMENQVLGYKSPLYGRRTAQFKISPFTFFESLPFFAAFKPADKAALYGVTGGIPEYLNKINPRKNVRQNIIDLFLSPSGHFFEEPSNLIKQELREPSTYNVIIESIACGASRLNEIATKSKLESNKCAKYLSSLIALGLVKKEYPFGETTGKRVIYRLEDFMFRFWYRFVFPNLSAVTAGLGEAVYDHEVERRFNAYMGFIFEDICKQWLFEQAKKNALPFFIGAPGRWWGANPATRAQEEIDIMAARKNDALLAECKWSDSDTDVDVLNELRRKCELFHYKNVYLYIFAKKSFTRKLLAAARENETVRLVGLAEMVESV
jgi:AAA+ ATPase superfamily predicted ATPase